MNYLNKPYINLHLIFNFNQFFFKPADTGLFIVHWRQFKRGKSMQHEEISQRHININILHSTTIISSVHFQYLKSERVKQLDLLIGLSLVHAASQLLASF